MNKCPHPNPLHRGGEGIADLGGGEGIGRQGGGEGIADLGGGEGIGPQGAQNWGIIGHRRAVGLLRQGVANSRVSHAYLISGPPQVGKTTLALTFARALNCDAAPDPCGQCRPCRLIAKGVHPDVRLLRLGAETALPGPRAARRRGRVKTISMEEIRDLLHDVVLMPYEAKWKVYVIRYAEDLSSEAIQTLLKTLEEPPPHVVLTLTTADAKILPLTIVSRCQQIRLGSVPMGEIAQALAEQRGVAPEQARVLAHLSSGRIGRAMGALSDSDLVATHEARLDKLLSALPARRIDRLASAERIATEFGRDPEAVFGTLETWLGWWRDLLLTMGGEVDRVVNVSRSAALTQQAARFQVGQVARAMRATRATLEQLQQNANPRLALEVLMLSVPKGTP